MQKVTLILSLLIVLVSCTVEPIDSIQNRTTSETLNSNDNSEIVSNDDIISNNQIIPTFMSANLNGFQYDGLKPMDYVDAT